MIGADGVVLKRIFIHLTQAFTQIDQQVGPIYVPSFRKLHCPGNVYKNKRVLLEAIHAKKTEKMKEPMTTTARDQFFEDPLCGGFWEFG